MSGIIKEFVVAGMRVKILPSDGLIDIRGRRGEAFFFMATITPERTLTHLKACLTAVKEAMRVGP